MNRDPRLIFKTEDESPLLRAKIDQLCIAHDGETIIAIGPNLAMQVLANDGEMITIHPKAASLLVAAILRAFGMDHKRKPPYPNR